MPAFRTIVLAVFVVLAIVAAGTSCAAKGTAVSTNPISLSFDEIKWTFSSNGKYMLVKDPRGLFQIFHPWDFSSDNDFGAIKTMVTVPAKWKGPFVLNFYASDTYVADGWEEVKPNWTHTYASCHNLVGHRFKQILIDNKLVWEQDVADTEEFGYTSVDISKFVKPGRKYELVCKVLDKLSPATKLPKDEFHLGIWSWQGLNDKDADKKFYTRVFWGDIAISEKPLPWAENPAYVSTPFAPVPKQVYASAVDDKATFILSAPNGLPENGYPVTWGIPFAQGKLSDAGSVNIVDPAGKVIPLQTKVLKKHADGSIKWLLLDFQADNTGAGKEYTLRYGTAVKPGPVQSGLTVTKSETEVKIDTGAVSFLVKKGSDSIAEAVTLAGESQPLGNKIIGLLRNRDGWKESDFKTINENIDVTDNGPERATLSITGHLVCENKTFGRFTCRIHAYRNKPYLRVLFRVFNDTDVPAQLVTGIELRVQTSMVTASAVIGDQTLQTGQSETERLLVRQNKCDMYEIFQGNDARCGTGAHFNAPVTLQTEKHGVSGKVLHFAQLYPKRAWAGTGGNLVFDLFTPTIEYEQYVMTRGEAKRHEVLLYFHKGTSDQPDIQAAFRTFDAQPMLLSAEWYADNQAFGRGSALTQDRFPELHKWMVEGREPSLNCYQPIGLRNWPDGYSDSVYSAYRATWGNLYQEIDYGAYIVGLLAGRREWLDYALAYQQHFMDLDICHYSPDSQWIGASYGISPYHTGHEPYPLNAPLGGLFVAYYLTGDPDAWDTAVGIADWLYNTNQGFGAGSGRAVGWPLRSAMIAYENTGDSKHLEIGRKLAEYALQAAEKRRGFFSETPATWQYRGGNSTMNAILMAGLIHYWRLTDDEQVGRLCSNLAHNMAYSWMSPLEPGVIYGGDPLQQSDVTGYAMQDVSSIFWGYELTGDETFLKKGSEMMQQSILDKKRNGAAFGLTRYWEMQDVLYYYKKAQELNK